VHDVRDRDIVVLGSDGLWDNLFDIKVIELIRPFIRDTDLLADPELVAEVVASEAEKYSL
jgi:serine/threonine protein phosphatase PrpC